MVRPAWDSPGSLEMEYLESELSGQNPSANRSPSRHPVLLRSCCAPADPARGALERLRASPKASDRPWPSAAVPHALETLRRTTLDPLPSALRAQRVNPRPGLFGASTLVPRAS